MKSLMQLPIRQCPKVRLSGNFVLDCWNFYVGHDFLLLSNEMMSKTEIDFFVNLRNGTKEIITKMEINGTKIETETDREIEYINIYIILKKHLLKIQRIKTKRFASTLLSLFSFLILHRVHFKSNIVEY